MELTEFIYRLGDCTDRAEAELLLAQAMSAFEALTGSFFPVTDTREYPVHCGSAFIDPVLSIASTGIVTTCCSSTTVTGWCLGGVQGEAYTQVKSLWVPRIRVTGVFGLYSLANMPLDVKSALINYAKANRNIGQGRVTSEKAGLVEQNFAAWDGAGFKSTAGKYRRWF